MVVDETCALALGPGKPPELDSAAREKTNKTTIRAGLKRELKFPSSGGCVRAGVLKSFNRNVRADECYTRGTPGQLLG